MSASFPVMTLLVFESFLKKKGPYTLCVTCWNLWSSIQEESLREDRDTSTADIWRLNKPASKLWEIHKFRAKFVASIFVSTRTEFVKKTTSWQNKANQLFSVSVSVFTYRLGNTSSWFERLNSADLIFYNIFSSCFVDNCLSRVLKSVGHMWSFPQI